MWELVKHGVGWLRLCFCECILRVAYSGVSIGLGSAKMDGVGDKNDVKGVLPIDQICMAGRLIELWTYTIVYTAECLCFASCVGLKYDLQIMAN